MYIRQNNFLFTENNKNHNSVIISIFSKYKNICLIEIHIRLVNYYTFQRKKDNYFKIICFYLIFNFQE